MSESIIKEHIVKAGTYIPIELTKFPIIPDKSMQKPKIVHNYDIEHNYPFLDKSFKGRLRNFGIYAGIFLMVFPLNHIRYGLRIKGKKNIRKNKALLKNGAMTVSNHVYRWDFLAVLEAVKYRRMWFPARALQIQSMDSNLIRGAGGIPIPTTISALRDFYASFDELHQKKKWIHVFPESCRWDYYQPIRPFKKGTFKMAYKYNLPIIPMVFTFRRPGGIYKLFGVTHPLITLHIGEIILPQGKEGQSKNEICNAMLENAHKQMENMAGIEQNMWPTTLD